ncbi:DUF2130 domain-containing protein [Spiroplasma tabanidicola]|uniref:DUF2130 domain-containing protein n=1 Tax=Spiroplasma tabanidicola TaxID=324079 RepID=A0A6I6CCM3_9MOLU|nr:DUF2130 domain-containing protein [Spiroplasma tabanidicola]QGS52038.1 hypothetical protein STABA_v1c06790 [Spiroplasma tabanidicola]
MELDFICPKCGQKITEKDFDNSEQSLKNLNDFLESKKQEYIKELEKKLITQLDAQKKAEITSALAKQNEEFILEKNKLKLEINTLSINNEKMIEKAKNEKDIEITKLKEQINNFDQKLVSDIEKAKALQIQAMQKEKDELNLAISTNKDLISKLEANIKVLEASKKEEILIEKDKLRNEYDLQIKELNNQIMELKEANIQYKVIQNKTKGENFEHDVEAELRKVFPDDVIKKITSQSQKADYLQLVKENNVEVGKIVYEVKNATWSKTWEKKLIEDTAKEGAKYGILIATSFNDQYRGIPFKVSDENQNIFLTDADSFAFVGHIIRTLIKTEARLLEKYSRDDKNEKVESFNKWRDTSFVTVSKVFEDQFKRIEDSENAITNKLNEIRIAREKIFGQWKAVIKNFIEGLNL